MTNINETNWQDFAACLDHPEPDTWFPVGTTGPAIEQAREAKAVCASCPVKSFCLEFAFEIGATDGIFGGLDEQERRGLRLSRTVPARKAG